MVDVLHISILTDNYNYNGKAKTNIDIKKKSKLQFNKKLKLFSFNCHLKILAERKIYRPELNEETDIMLLVLT